MEVISKLHPMVIHFPIALFVVYTLLEFIALFFKNGNFSKVILIILGMGVFFAILAVLTGNKAAEACEKLVPPDVSEIIETHETFATITLFFYATLFLIKFYVVTKLETGRLLKYAFLILTLIGNIFIYLTGYYGGQLVFKHGVGTELMKINK